MSETQKFEKNEKTSQVLLICVGNRTRLFELFKETLDLRLPCTTQTWFMSCLTKRRIYRHQRRESLQRLVLQVSEESESTGLESDQIAWESTGILQSH